jgi:hypothetical protein
MHSGQIEAIMNFFAPESPPVSEIQKMTSRDDDDG